MLGTHSAIYSWWTLRCMRRRRGVGKSWSSLTQSPTIGPFDPVLLSALQGQRKATAHPRGKVKMPPQADDRSRDWQIIRQGGAAFWHKASSGRKSWTSPGKNPITCLQKCLYFGMIYDNITFCTQFVFIWIFSTINQTTTTASTSFKSVHENIA